MFDDDLLVTVELIRLAESPVLEFIIKTVVQKSARKLSQVKYFVKLISRQWQISAEGRIALISAICPGPPPRPPIGMLRAVAVAHACLLLKRSD